MNLCCICIQNKENQTIISGLSFTTIQFHSNIWFCFKYVEQQMIPQMPKYYFHEHTINSSPNFLQCVSTAIPVCS